MMKTKTIITLFSAIFLLSCTTKAIANPAVAETLVEDTRNAEPTSINNNGVATIPVCSKSGMELNPSDNFGIPGTIVYQKDFQGLYTVGGEPLVYSKLPVDEQQKIFAFGFSPDGQWLAFSPMEFSPSGDPVFKTPKVILLSADGQRIEHTFSVDSFADELPVANVFQGFSGYSHWINNTTVYAALYALNPDPSTSRHISDLFTVMDPFSGVWREDLLKGLPPSTSSYAKGISPDLTRMLYEDGDGLSLKDLEKASTIWHEKDLFAAFSALMFWSPDSETVAYANQFESPESRTVVLISRDGVAKPIMGPTASVSGLQIMDLRWSPDGQYLALLVWEGEDVEASIFIYDFKAQKYVSQCPIGNSTDMGQKLIWSPDNKYILYVGGEYPLTIMNVASGEIRHLADNTNAVGWSDKFPVVWQQR